MALSWEALLYLIWFLSRHQRYLFRGEVKPRPVVRARAAEQKQLISLKK
jgi:hypothetical protein